MNARRILSPWKLLVAALATFAASAPAQAGLTLQATGPGINSITHYGNPLGANETNAPGNDGPYSISTITFQTLDNNFNLVNVASFTGTVSATTAGTSQTITISGILTGLADAVPSQSYNFNLFGGLFQTVPAGSSATLFGSASAIFTNAPGGRLESTARYSDTDGNVQTSLIVVTPSQGSGSEFTPVTNVANSFRLTSFNATITGLNINSSVDFTASATLSTTAAPVPEPVSIVAGLLGLPCVGGVVGFARRKLGKVTA